MEKIISIKLTKTSPNIGPFDVLDSSRNLIDSGVPKDDLIEGKSYIVDSAVTGLTLQSTGKCTLSISKQLSNISKDDYNTIEVITTAKACLWKHMQNYTIFNSFYNKTEPFIIEYPFSFTISKVLQDVTEYSKVYKYFSNSLNTTSTNDKTMLDNVWYNKAVLYNDQQSTGVLELDPKPTGNMQEYLKYPKFNASSKTILWTKTDNVYNYNTFWSLVKDSSSPLFKSSCESLSIDKVVNQDNMDYSARTYIKDTLRAKDLKVRHILDNRNDVLLVTQFILSSTMNSYL